MVSPAEGPSLGMAAGGQVDVDIAAAEKIGVQAELPGVAAEVAQSGLGRILKDAPQGAG